MIQYSQGFGFAKAKPQNYINLGRNKFYKYSQNWYRSKCRTTASWMTPQSDQSTRAPNSSGHDHQILWEMLLNGLSTISAVMPSSQFQDHEAYMRFISCWYRSCMSFLFNLNAAVTSPMSGDHTSAQSFTAAGISNFNSLPEQK